jgi:ribitol-5-phosphate 2-dehydrogenase (NADP+) / D-ribitol-5-phosphate cytidylyltransferase
VTAISVKPSDPPIVCIVLAGGNGVRFGQEIPKQFARLAGTPVLQRTLSAIDRYDDVTEIVVVANAAWMSETEAITRKCVTAKPCRVVSGGDTRGRSTLAGLLAFAHEEAKVLIHDAVRPFISHEVIERCVAALDRADAVDTVIPTGDTIVEIDGSRIATIPDRSRLRRGQTPQGFWLSDIRSAYAAAERGGYVDAPDDCSVLLWARPDAVIATVNGEERNLKITTEIDLDIADRLLQSEGAGIDLVPEEASLAGRRVAIIGGSSGIGRAMIEGVAALGGSALACSRSINGVDVRERESVGTFLASCADDGGPVTDLVVTAGKLVVEPLLSSNWSEMHEVVDVNLWGALNVASAGFEALRASRGSLLFFTSSSFTRGRAGYAVYSATKAAVVNLCQALAEEWADSGIRVNVMSPGRTDTPMRTRAFGAEDPSSLIPAERVAAAAVRALASPLTGQVFHVRHNGGTW